MQPDGWAMETQPKEWLKILKKFWLIRHIYEKSNDPEIKGVRDALLHMILFNLFLANLLLISNSFCKFLQSRAMQFFSMPNKVEGMEDCLRKYMENIETGRSFFLNYADHYLHVAQQQ